SVFFIQKLWLPSASKTKSMPRPSARDLRYMSPRSRSAGVAATSSEISTAAPGPRITATGPRSRQPARASAAATAARMTRCCMGESRGLSGEHADRHPVHRVPAGRGGALHLPGLGPVQPAARGQRKVHSRPYRRSAAEPTVSHQGAAPPREAYLNLPGIGTVVNAGPVYDASRLVLHAGEPGIAGEGAWEPLSNHVVRPLLAGMDPGFAATAGGVAWWAHNLSVLVMLNFLPLAKHFHVVTSLPNVFFRKLEPLGALSKQD